MRSIFLKLFKYFPDLVKIGIYRYIKNKLYIPEGTELNIVMDFESYPDEKNKISLEDTAHLYWDIREKDIENFKDLVEQAKLIITNLTEQNSDNYSFAQFDNANVVMKGESLESLSVGGSPVDDTKNYRLAINSFIAAGGDGYMKVTGLPTFVDSGFIDADVLKEYIQKNSPLNPADYAPTDDVIRK